jgi:hypothetical protein
LATGIAAAIAVVFFKVSDSMGAAAVAGTTAFCVLLGVWLGYPVWRRTSCLSLGAVQSVSAG